MHLTVWIKILPLFCTNHHWNIHTVTTIHKQIAYLLKAVQYVTQWNEQMFLKKKVHDSVTEKSLCTDYQKHICDMAVINYGTDKISGWYSYFSS